MTIDQNLIIIFLSFLFFAIGLVKWQKGGHLNKNGKITEGIIFRNNYKSNFDKDGKYYPVVRFLTENKEWITQEIDIGFSSAKKEGQTVALIYDPEEPTNVTFHSDLYLKMIPVGLTLLGLGGMIFGTLKFLEIV